MARLVVLLRGINVGRTKLIGMAELREALEARGYRDVRTLLRSGNVVVSSSLSVTRVQADVASCIQDAFGFDVAVMGRTATQLSSVVDEAPLADVADSGAKHMVAFLSAEPDAAAVRALEARDFGDEQVAVCGREVYAWCPGGTQQSPALKAIGTELRDVEVTVRNWNTVTKLLALARAD